MACRPAAPPNITKEHQGIWDAWTFKNDREVAREAAAKGHVTLAIQFLSVKNNIQQDQAKDFINSEVFKWVAELLDRKQIFRVSHILTNVGINPGPELITVFCETDKKYLRDYIFDYLSKTGQITPELQDIWNFLEIIAYNVDILTFRNKLRQESIRCLQEKSIEWKHDVAGKLFLKTQDLRLVPFLSADILWRMLLNFNNMDLINTWIDMAFFKKSEEKSGTEAFLDVFKLFPITDDMINDVLNYAFLPHTQDQILKRFCKFGKFAKSDLNSIVTVLERICKADYVSNVYQILAQKHSNVSIKKFTELLTQHCIDNQLLTVLNNVCDKLDLLYLNSEYIFLELKLILGTRYLVPYFKSSVLCDNLFYASQYLSKFSLIEFFCDKQVLVLSLILFSQNLSVITAMKDKSLRVQNVDLYKALELVMETCQIFRNIYINKIFGIKANISYYDLAFKHLNINIKNTSLSANNPSFPNFGSLDLIKTYGYQKIINYIFYIKQCRPSVACTKFKGITELETKQRKVAKLGILNVQNPTVMAASVGFFELSNQNSILLRLYFQAIGILNNAGFEFARIKDLFLKNIDEYSTIVSVLEDVLVGQIDFENLMLGANFVEAVKYYEVVFRFCIQCNLPFPEAFLKQCASLDLWLPFVLYSQMKNYPITQTKALVPNFKNPNLVEHIVHSVINDIHLEDLNVLKGERNSRKYYLSRIGVRHSSEQLSAENLYSSFSGTSSQGSSIDSLEIDVSNVKTTLLQTLIRCHNSTDPPKALLQACQLYKYPFLAIVANCYEPDSVVTYWIAWLSVSTDMYELFTCFEALTVSGSSVTNFLNKCMENRFPKTLMESAMIFMPESPLTYFIQFLNFLIFKENDIVKLKYVLNKFRKSKNQRRGSIFSEKDYEMMYIKNKLWIETTSLKLLASALTYNIESTFEQEEFVDILCQVKIRDYFDCESPNFDCLLNILKFIFGTDILFDISKFFDNDNYLKANLTCIYELTNKRLFKETLEIAHLVGIDTDLIVIEKWNQFLQPEDNKYLSTLRECDKSFEIEDVSPESVVKFYLEKLNSLQCAERRYELLKLAFKWSKIHKLRSLSDLEKQLILAYINFDNNFIKLHDLDYLAENFNSLTFQELLHKTEVVDFVTGNHEPELIQAVCPLLEKALDTDRFWLALKLERIFGCKSFNLTVLKTCHKLAEKIITPAHLDREQKFLLEKMQNFQKSNFHVEKFDLVDKDNFVFLSLEPTASTRQILAMIHCLVEKLEHGVELGRRILRMYRMSINIDIPYYVLVSETDSGKMLKLALDEDCANKLEVVNDFILVFRPTTKQLADFLSGEIISASLKYIKSKTDKFDMWDLDLNSQFHLILHLLRDNCSTLGYKLYNYASVLHKAQLPSEFDFRISELALIVELLITAHHCFTADCNMDGISMVLRKNRSLISHLLTLRSWKLLVRLFIGIGRFSEMNYVFHILKEHEQFEYLLRKGSRKDDRLKESLLEYIRRFCPDNTELYKMVALHFTLYSEVAELWEREADHLIKDLISIAKLEMENEGLTAENETFVLFSSSTGTLKYLDKILENYTHATEFHMQGGKLSRAMNSVKKGELVALQKSLLNPSNENGGKAMCLLNLNTTQITVIMSKSLTFLQSYILVQAYNFVPDWALVLFDQCILQNNFQYLNDYISLLPFKENLVQDISRKFINANLNTPQEIVNMKNIVGRLISVHAKYRIASELGFTDLVEDLLDKGHLAYLKDTVWKKGYRRES